MVSLNFKTDTVKENRLLRNSDMATLVKIDAK